MLLPMFIFYLICDSHHDVSMKFLSKNKNKLATKYKVEHEMHISCYYMFISLYDSRKIESNKTKSENNNKNEIREVDE